MVSEWTMGVTPSVLDGQDVETLANNPDTSTAVKILIAFKEDTTGETLHKLLSETETRVSKPLCYGIAAHENTSSETLDRIWDVVKDENPEEFQKVIGLAVNHKNVTSDLLTAIFCYENTTPNIQGKILANPKASILVKVLGCRMEGLLELNSSTVEEFKAKFAWKEELVQWVTDTYPDIDWEETPVVWIEELVVATHG